MLLTKLSYGRNSKILKLDNCLEIKQKIYYLQNINACDNNKVPNIELVHDTLYNIIVLVDLEKLKHVRISDKHASVLKNALTVVINEEYNKINKKFDCFEDIMHVFSSGDLHFLSLEDKYINNYGKTGNINRTVDITFEGTLTNNISIKLNNDIDKNNPRPIKFWIGLHNLKIHENTSDVNLDNNVVIRFGSNILKKFNCLNINKFENIQLERCRTYK